LLINHGGGKRKREKKRAREIGKKERLNRCMEGIKANLRMGGKKES